MPKELIMRSMSGTEDICQLNSAHPWLSVIVPIYNAEKYLSKCVKSILSQTMKDFEVILIDDGSQDDSYMICLSFEKEDSRVRCFHKINAGSFQTRLYGVEQAKGEYITFCDADDYYVHSNAFSIIYEAIVKSKCSVLQFGYQKKYNHLKKTTNTVSNIKLVSGENLENNEFPKLICSFWEPSHLTNSVYNKVYHRSLVNNLPASEIAERAFWGDDLVINLYLLENALSILFLPQCLYVYRQGSGGTSLFNVHTMDDLDFIKQHQIKFLEGRDDKEILEKILFSEIAGWFFLWVKQALDQLEEKTVKQHIERILQLPSFVMAQSYYEKLDSRECEAVELLRKADSDIYITCAKKANDLDNGREIQLLRVLKKIYFSI